MSGIFIHAQMFIIILVMEKKTRENFNRVLCRYNHNFNSISDMDDYGRELCICDVNVNVQCASE